MQTFLYNNLPRCERFKNHQKSHLAFTFSPKELKQKKNIPKMFPVICGFSSYKEREKKAIRNVKKKKTVALCQFREEKVQVRGPGPF